VNNATTSPPGHKWLGTRTIRYIVILILLVLGLFILSREVDHLKANDFSRYWLSSRLLLSGADPYNASQALTDPEAAGMSLEQSCITYNPPWTLPLIAVFGLFSRPVGQMIWLLVQVTAVLLCTLYIWKMYAGQPKHRWMALLLAFTFGPVVAAVVLQGQISPIILLGLIGFLIFIDRPQKSWLAGVFLIPASLKPQVLYLFFIAFFLWVVFSRKRSALVSFVSIIILLGIIVYLIDPQVYKQYLQCMSEKGPANWATPTFGFYMRLLNNQTGFQLQFLPSIIGTAWMLYFWLKHRLEWEWKREMPLILFVTTISAAYIWTYDLVVLLLPLLLAFIGLLGHNRRWEVVVLVACYVVIDLLYLWLHLRMDDSKFIWLAPALFIWYIAARAIHNVPVLNGANQKSA
jgi:Glycosyltransferase family 87